MSNYLLILAYDGTDFHGWQSQPDARTVQDELESALGKLFAPGIRATAAGRTDAGVHALALPVNFVSGIERPTDVVMRALNALLPDDLRVMECRRVPDGFSARFNALSRTYRYLVSCEPVFNPIERRYLWHLPVELNWESVHNSLSLLAGEHDFTSFRGSGCVSKTPIRRMISAEAVFIGENRFALRFQATGFLKQMVRSIVGTVVEIGKGDRPVSDMALLLERPDRAAAGRTAPAHGLYFVCAEYPELFNE
jgi:tRNA pseudouridine38-40 synthase